MIRLATVFSGIGSIEHAINRMNIDNKVVFACDNGERELKMTEEEILENTKNLNEKDKQEYINELYNKTGKENFVEQSYLANYKLDKESFYQDVRFLNAKRYEGQVDLIVGGSPCQSFSIIGKRAGLKDKQRDCSNLGNNLIG